jgi:hypothetical protein
LPGVADGLGELATLGPSADAIPINLPITASEWAACDLSPGQHRLDFFVLGDDGKTSNVVSVTYTITGAVVPSTGQLSIGTAASVPIRIPGGSPTVSLPLTIGFVGSRGTGPLKLEYSTVYPPDWRGYRRVFATGRADCVFDAEEFSGSGTLFLRVSRAGVSSAEIDLAYTTNSRPTLALTSGSAGLGGVLGLNPEDVTIAFDIADADPNDTLTLRYSIDSGPFSPLATVNRGTNVPVTFPGANFGTALGSHSIHFTLFDGTEVSEAVSLSYEVIPVPVLSVSSPAGANWGLITNFESSLYTELSVSDSGSAPVEIQYRTGLNSTWSPETETTSGFCWFYFEASLLETDPGNYFVQFRGVVGQVAGPPVAVHYQIGEDYVNEAPVLALGSGQSNQIRISVNGPTAEQRTIALDLTDADSALAAVEYRTSQSDWQSLSAFPPGAVTVTLPPSIFEGGFSEGATVEIRLRANDGIDTSGEVTVTFQMNRRPTIALANSRLTILPDGPVAIGITVGDADGDEPLAVVFAFDSAGPWATLSGLTELPASVLEGHRTIGASYLLYFAVNDGLDQSSPVWLEYTVESDDPVPPPVRSPFQTAVPKSPSQSRSPAASLPPSTPIPERTSRASPIATGSPRPSKSALPTGSAAASVTAAATPPPATAVRTAEASITPPAASTPLETPAISASPPSQSASQGQPESGGPSSPSAPPSRSPTPARTPRAIEVSEGEMVEVPSNEEEPVMLTGTGTIGPGSGQEVKLGEVTVGEEAEIVAEGLVITGRLALEGHASLSAAENAAIDLADRAVDIEFTGDAKMLPVLDLGQIGDNYQIVPKSLKVDPPTGLSEDERGSFSHRLISGTTLSNCEEWQKLLELPASFTSECIDVPGSGSGGRLLSGGGVRSLVVKGVPKAPPGSPSPDEGSNATIIVVVVAGVAGVVVIAVVAVVVWLVRRKNRVDTYSGRSVSDESSESPDL